MFDIDGREGYGRHALGIDGRGRVWYDMMCMVAHGIDSHRLGSRE